MDLTTVVIIIAIIALCSFIFGLILGVKWAQPPRNRGGRMRERSSYCLALPATLLFQKNRTFSQFFRVISAGAFKKIFVSYVDE